MKAVGTFVEFSVYLILLFPPHLFQFLGSMFLTSCLHIARFCVSSPRQSLLPQVHIYTVHPPLLRSSYPSPPLYIHLRQSFPHIFFIDSHNMSEPLSPYFLHLRGYLLSLLFTSFSTPSFPISGIDVSD